MDTRTYYKIENNNGSLPPFQQHNINNMFSQHHIQKPQSSKTGLVNLGNTCFLNSILQCLHSTVAFNDYLQSDHFDKRISFVAINNITDMIKNKLHLTDSKTRALSVDESKELFLSYQLSKLFKSLDSNYPIIRPISFVQMFFSKNTSFTSGAQADGPEALKTILDLIHEELSSNVVVNFPTKDPNIIELLQKKQTFVKILKDKKTSYEQKMDAKNEYYDYKTKHMDTYLISQSYKYWKKHIEKYKCSKITELYDGTILGTTHCKECKKTSYSFTPNRFLQLPIPESSSQVSLYDCFKLYCKPEVLDDSNKYKCHTCNKLVNATRELSIWEPPTILIIHLVRFTQYGSRYVKNHTDVCFPLELNMYPYVSKISTSRYSPTDNSKYIYELYTISNHYGEHGGGHYTAYSKDKSNMWYEYNDQTSTPISPQKALTNPSAYMLFYRYKKID